MAAPVSPSRPFLAAIPLVPVSGRIWPPPCVPVAAIYGRHTRPILAHIDKKKASAEADAIYRKKNQ